MNQTMLSRFLVLLTFFLSAGPSLAWACAKNGRIVRAAKQCCSKSAKRFIMRSRRRMRVLYKCTKRRSWNKSNIQQAISSARQEAVRKKQNSDSGLRRLRSSLSSHLETLKNGVCKSKNIKVPGKKCKKKCKWGKCVKVCKPTIRNRKIKMCVSTDGVKFKGPKKWLSFEIKNLKKKYRALKRKKDDIQRKTKKLAKDIANKAIKAFKKGLAEFQRRAKAMAKKLSQNKTFRNPIVQLVAKKLAVKSYTTWGTFKSTKSASLMKDVRTALSKNNRRNELKNTMRSKQQRHTRLKSYGKTAAIAVGLAVGMNALKVTYKCWQYGGSHKRHCLNVEVAIGLRDASFDTLAGFLQGAIDIELIEPSSHTMAGMISSALASLTVGIGAVAYPIAYLVSSVALNVVLSLIIEKQGRHRYNKWFESKLGAQTRRFSKNLVSKIPTNAMRCYSHCKSHYGAAPRPRPRPQRPTNVSMPGALSGWQKRAGFAIHCSGSCPTRGPGCKLNIIRGQCAYPIANAQQLCARNPHCKAITCLARYKHCFVRKHTRYTKGSGFTSYIRPTPTNNRPHVSHRPHTQVYLYTVAHGKKCLDAHYRGNGVHMVPCGRQANRRWTLHKDGTLRNEYHKGKCLEAPQVGKMLRMSRCNRNPKQRWYTKYIASKRAYRIYSRFRNQCLDAYHRGNGAHIVRCHNGNNQFWYLSKRLR